MELLVAFAVAMAVVAGALTVALSSHRLYAADLARTNLNQNMRASREFLVDDIRQAGERLPVSFPAIVIVRGEDLPGGTPGGPDELVLRRNLLDTTLRSCADVEDGERDLHIADLGPSPEPGCSPVPDGNGDGWPDNHGAWRSFRLSEGQSVDGGVGVPAYLYDPTNGNGEFFTYWDDDLDEASIQTAAGQSWTHDYPASHGCRIFLLEERRYRVAGDVLQVVVNQAPAFALSLVDRVDDFQLRARFRIPSPPAPQDEPPAAESFGFGDDWGRLRAVEVTMAGRFPMRDRLVAREWTSEIMPRNVLSR